MASSSTLEDLAEARSSRSGRRLRRVGLGLLLAICLGAGLTPRQGQVSAEVGTYTLAVQYPLVTRSGLPAPLHIQLRRPGGFDGPVTLQLDDSYFNHFDFQNWYPNPAAEKVSAGGQLLYTYPRPRGDVLDVSLDARTAPLEAGIGNRFTVAVLQGGGRVLDVHFRVWVMP